MLCLQAEAMTPLRDSLGVTLFGCILTFSPQLSASHHPNLRFGLPYKDDKYVHFKGSYL